MQNQQQNQAAPLYSGTKKATHTSSVKTRQMLKSDNRQSVNSPNLETDDDRTALMDFLSNMVGEKVVHRPRTKLDLTKNAAVLKMNPTNHFYKGIITSKKKRKKPRQGQMLI